MNTELIQLIKERRSIRSFRKEPLKKTDIDTIIQAGKYAPSAKDVQPWRFIVITNASKINYLSGIVKSEISTILKRRFIYQIFAKDLRNQKALQTLYVLSKSVKDVIFYDAPALIFIVSKKGLFNDESCSCCAENMMLAAHSLGIGSCWIGYASFLERNKKVLLEIGIPSDMHIVSALIFGYPKKEKKQMPIRKPMADVINWIE